MRTCPQDKKPCHRTDGCECGDVVRREAWELAAWLAATFVLVAVLEIVRRL